MAGDVKVKSLGEPNGAVLIHLQRLCGHLVGGVPRLNVLIYKQIWQPILVNLFPVLHPVGHVVVGIVPGQVMGGLIVLDQIYSVIFSEQPQCHFN